MKGQIIVSRIDGDVVIRCGRSTARLSPEAARMLAARLVVAADESIEQAFTCVRDVVEVASEARSVVDNVRRLFG